MLRGRIVALTDDDDEFYDFVVDEYNSLAQLLLNVVVVGKACAGHFFGFSLFTIRKRIFSRTHTAAPLSVTTFHAEPCKEKLSLLLFLSTLSSLRFSTCRDTHAPTHTIRSSSPEYPEFSFKLSRRRSQTLSTANPTLDTLSSCDCNHVFTRIFRLIQRVFPSRERPIFSSSTAQLEIAKVRTRTEVQLCQSSGLTRDYLE